MLHIAANIIHLFSAPAFVLTVASFCAGYMPKTTISLKD